MKKLLSIVAIFVFFAACHGAIDAEGDATPSENKSTDTAFSELTVKWRGAVVPEPVSKTVTIDSGREISVSLDQTGLEDDAVSNLCSGEGLLDEEDYERVLELVDAAELLGYAPPSEEECDPLLGTQGIDITYEESDGDSAEFWTGFCPLDEEIDDLISYVNSLALSYVDDCSLESLGSYDVEEVPAEDSDGDCIPDAVESQTGTDPNDPDTDGDGLPDGWVATTGLGEDLNCNGYVDRDEDGAQLETDPRFADSDDDGIDDFDEMTNCCLHIEEAVDL